MHPLLAITVAVAAQSGVATDREADMFGAPSTVAADHEADMFGDPSGVSAAPEGGNGAVEPGTSDASRDDALFGGDDSVSPTVVTPGFMSSVTPGLLDDANNALTIGGSLFLRMNASFREGTPLAEGTMTGPSLLDAFADVRPNDRIRGFAQLRFNFDYTVVPGEKNAFGVEQEPFSLQLAQAWTKFDLGHVAYVTAGRQRIRWGTGRFWNPTDFVNQEVRNSVDFFDQRVGVDMIKVHFPFEALGWNLYLISTIGGVDVLKDTGLAARAEFVFGPAELALSSAVKEGSPLRFGADASAGIWLFDVKAEGVLSKGLGRKLFEGELDFETGELPTEVNTDDNWYFEGVVGIETQLKYTDSDTLAVGAEYFYNQAGYTSASIYPFLFLNNAYTPLYTGQHYFAAYVSAPAPFQFNDLVLTVSTLGNLSDLSFLSRLDVQYTLLQYLTLNAFVAAHYGSVGEFRLGLDIPAIPLIPQLANGLTLANDFVDVGLALRVAF